MLSLKILEKTFYFLLQLEMFGCKLEQRFGEANGTKIFRVLRDLCIVSHNDLSVADYFTQIKKMWDDYNSMISIPPRCSCGITCASLKAINKII